MHYKICIEDRNYNNYYYLNHKTLQKADEQPNINAIKEKLFNHDIINFQDNNCKLLHSTVRSSILPGILVLENNIRYGTTKSDKPRYLYKCIPDDKRLPEFLIPYNIKLGFSKKLNNIYIIFKFVKWDSTMKHPQGICCQKLGEVTFLNSFYEYQLYCKSLYASITQFNRDTMKKLREKSEDEYIDLIKNKYTIENRTKNHMKNVKIFSIDPQCSKDFDDAFSLWEPHNSMICVISIYISNVSFWLDALELWDSFSNRISTIYLPDRKRPMLPTILSDALCSLTEGNNRFALTLDLYVHKETGEIVRHKFKNTMINVDKNLRYDTKEQEEYEDYKKLFKIVKLMNKKNKYTDNLNNSHDMVAYLMIKMNYLCALTLKKHKTGIYRSSKYNTIYQPPITTSGEIQKFLKMWHSFGGKYCKFKDIDNHDMLELDAYVHATSPIRRLVDLLISLDLQKVEKLSVLSKDSETFYNKWTSDEKIEYINKTMRSIRKVQNDCSLLNLCENNKDMLEKIYMGFIFDKIERNDKLYQYMVYIPELKMVNRFTSRYDMINNENYEFKIFIFIDEIRLKQKIRLELIQ